MLRQGSMAACRAVVCILLAAAGVAPVHAVSTYWQHDPATPGDWFDPANWSNWMPTAAYWAYINNGGAAEIRGGSAAVKSLGLGFTPGSSGTAELSGTGQFLADNVTVGYNGIGRFIQSAGTSTINNTLFIGCLVAGQGTYELAGTAQLSVAVEYLGYRGTGRFEHTGGSHAVSYLYVNPSSRYVFTRGTFDISSNGGLNLKGTLDLAESTVSIRAGDNTLVDLSAGTLLNASHALLEVGSNSLTILGPTFDPAATFGTFKTSGMIHRAGTDLVVSSVQSFSGSGVVNDHVRCDGIIAASQGGGLLLSGGLTISGEGNVNLGGFVNLGADGYNSLSGGTLLVNDQTSGMTGGRLSAIYMEVGTNASAPGRGRFVQTGGTATVHNFDLALNDGTFGEYQLSDAGQLSADTEQVGYGGTGQLLHSGGTNAVKTLYIGRGSGALGRYQLSGSGQVSTMTTSVGFYGTGMFIQTAGTHAVSYVLEVGALVLKGGGYDFTGAGTYELSGEGKLSAPTEKIGKWGMGRFIQSGGTNAVSSGLYLAYEAGSNGEYELSETGQLSANHVWVGHFGAGRFIHTGGSNSIGDRLVLGHGDTGQGSYELSGSGQLSANLEWIGYLGRGQFLQDGGTNSIGGGLYIASEEGSRGTYQLSGTGQLLAAEEHVGGNGNGLFTHNGGANSISAGLHLASSETGNGAYELGESGQLTASDEYIGEIGRGQFTHTGGTNSLSGVLSIAPGPDADGTYQLSGAAELSANWEVVGGYGTGRFIHTGGRNSIAQDLSVGHAAGGDGTYLLSGTGQVSAYFEAVGEEGTGRFVQSGGTNAVEFVLRLAGWEGSNGTYELTGNGQLSAEFELVGSKGVGHFIHSGGTNTVLGDLSVGHDTGGDGTYHLGGTAQLSANNEFVGFAGTGRLVQTGGSNVICDTLHIGYQPGSHGTYTISGGRLTTSDLSVDYGTLEIADPAAQVTVSNRLSFGAEGNFAAIPGATIHMTGAALENQSTDPVALAGLGNLTLIFEGGTEHVDPVEVAGRDLGPVLAGFQDNFALGTLQLGGTDVGQIRLADDFDNQPEWDGKEALYVWNLHLGPSSYLDLNGLSLYFVDGAIDPRATVVGGTLTPVPEPSAITLSVLGVLLLLACARRRPKKPQ